MVQSRLSQPALLSALEQLHRVVIEKKFQPLPLVRLFWNQGELRLMGRNDELGLCRVVRGEGSGSAQAALHVGLLLQLVKGCMGEVSLTLAGGQVEVAAGGYSALLNTAAEEPQDWAIPQAPYGLEGFGGLLRTVAYAASRDSLRLGYNCVLLDFAGARVEAVATDGFRLALTSQQTEGIPQRRWLLPPSAVYELARLKGEVRLGFAGEWLEVQTEDSYFSVHAPLENFPDYKRVLPQSSTSAVLVEATLLAEAIKRLLLIAKSDLKQVNLSGGLMGLELSAEGEVGAAKELVPATLEGEALAVSYNGQYLLEALQKVQGQATVKVNGPQMPSLVCAEGSPYQAVVVPLRIPQGA